MPIMNGVKQLLKDLSFDEIDETQLRRECVLQAVIEEYDRWKGFDAHSNEPVLPKTTATLTDYVRRMTCLHEIRNYLRAEQATISILYAQQLQGEEAEVHEKISCLALELVVVGLNMVLVNWWVKDALHKYYSI